MLLKAKEHIEEKMPWVEVEKVEKAWTKVEEFKTWWEKKDAQQEALAAHEAPAYLCKDAEKQAQALVEDFDKLRKTKKPKEKKNETKKNTTKKDKKKDKKKKEKDAEETAKDVEEDVPLTKEELTAKIEEVTAAKAKAVEDEEYGLADELKAELAA